MKGMREKKGSSVSVGQAKAVVDGKKLTYCTSGCGRPHNRKLFVVNHMVFDAWTIIPTLFKPDQLRYVSYLRIFSFLGACRSVFSIRVMYCQAIS